MKKAYKWVNFSDIYDFYKSGDFDNARTMLYNHMDRFMKDWSININVDLWYWYDDIKNDMFLKIEERILKSIEEWFADRQAYNYVKWRWRWFLLNALDTNRNKENNILAISHYYWWSDENELWDSSQDINMSMFDDASCINDAILSLSDKHKSIILLKYMSDDNIWIKDIAKYLWKTQYEVVCEHEQALLNLRDIIQNSYLSNNNEDENIR